jgi:hypothetical protein
MRTAVADETEDRTVAKLEAMLTELETHRDRLKQKARRVRQDGAVAPSEDTKKLYALVGDAIDEQVETGLDFQGALVTAIISELKNPGGPAGESDEVDEVVGIEPGHADTLMRALLPYKAMLGTLAKQSADSARELAAKIADCVAAIALVDELTLEDGPDDDEAEEGEDEEEAEEEPARPAN